jgi:hydroxyacylglutathione hydrolase
MYFERIESKGLAHYSYLIGDGTEAAVIDPRRDCDVYKKRARDAGMAVKIILETHRNEDYVTGSVELASQTGAEIGHADSQLDYAYGLPVQDGQTWDVGDLKLLAVHTPGHTEGHMSYLLHDPDGSPWMIFTGDCLFAGDVGRVDLLGMDRAEEMAGLLYESLCQKILPLGDGVIVCPAHGAGSVCGTAISERDMTTIGIERRKNPQLQHREKRAFVSHVARKLERPPYFRKMERCNIRGGPPLGNKPSPIPLRAKEFEKRTKDAIVVDTRMELGFSAAHVPGALSIWLGGLASFAGWFLPYDKPILLVNENDNFREPFKRLARLGFERIDGYLAEGMLSWHTAGLESHSIPTVTVQELCRLLDARKNPFILDVRSSAELERNGRIKDAANIHITTLPDHVAEIPKDRPTYIFCGSGMRSMIAASLLKRKGWTNLIVVLGGLAGWNSVSCPLDL